jgi:hypothetical protein
MTAKSVFPQPIVVANLLLGVLSSRGVLAQTNVPSAPAQSEQELLKTLDDAYQLEEAQVLRRFAPPFPEARNAFVAAKFGDSAEYVQSCYFYWDKGRFAFCKAHLFIPRVHSPSMPSQQGAPLSRVIGTITGTSRSRMTGRVDLLEKRIVGDLVGQASADRDQLAAALAKLLEAELQVPLRLEHTSSPLDVIVISNQEPRPNADAEKRFLEIGGLDPRVGIGEEQGDWKTFVDWLEWALSIPIVDETRGLEKCEFVWKFDSYRPGREDLTPGWTLQTALVNSRGKLLRSLSEQLDLTLRVERRTISIHRISVAETVSPE